MPIPRPLAALNARVAQELSYLTLPGKRWVPPRQVGGAPLIDVVVVGGGMAGLAANAALTFMGMVAVGLDARPRGLEGPWATTARMDTLRSPKTLTGPALGIPSLTFRAWFEAQFGAEEWERLDKIPRLQWMDYLRWYRDVLDLDIRNEHRVTDIRPMGDHVALAVSAPDGETMLLARHVVLATGRDGLGGPVIIDIAKGLPRERWAHSADDYDYSLLAGRRVGVVGAGASAMDSAATALEAGAARVDLLIRRDDIPRVNRAKALGSPGSVQGISDLADVWKWRIFSYVAREQVPPPRGSVLRVSRHANAHFHLGCTLIGAVIEGDAIRLETSKGVFRLDFMIFATGFAVDWARRPFLSTIAPHVRSWADRFSPDEPDGAGLLAMPDLGPAFEFRARTPDACPGLERIHCFCYPAVMTHGNISGDIPSISDGAERLARGIASSLFREDVEQHFHAMATHDMPEVFGDEWRPAAPPGEEEP